MTPKVSGNGGFSEVGKAMLVAGLVLLVCSAVLLVSAQGDLQRRNNEVQRANAALLRIAEINSLVIGVDYSARGYALSGQQLFLQHEHEKQARLKVVVKELPDMVDPGLRPAALSLPRLVEAHAAVYSGFVAQGPGRTAEMAAIITNPVERKKRYDVLNVLDRLHRSQLDALYAHQQAAEHQLRYTSILTFVIVAVAFLSGLLEMAARYFRQRKTHADGASNLAY